MDLLVPLQHPDELIDPPGAGLRLLRCLADYHIDAMRSDCQKHCFSTLNHIVGWCYNDRRVISFVLKRARHGFQGIRGQVGE